MNHRRPLSRATHCSLLTAHCSLILLFALTALPFAVRAQSATAMLSGTVEDERGAVIPGVNITVINLATSAQRQTTTNSEGYFVVPLLPPSRYQVTAENQGFTTVRIPEVILNVNDQKSLVIQLKVGSVGATVDVKSDAPLINESPAVGTVVDRQFVANLPLNGRSFQSLITLTPGTVLTAASGVEPGQFSVNGQRADANYFTIDGVSANVAATYSTGTAYSQSSSGSVPALAATGGTNNLVSVDALQEFKVLTSTYAPEFGRQPGGQVLITTRPGTNDFHGTLFEYFRNDVLDANDWFANSRRQNKAPLRQNIFGGVLGGPVLLPRFGEGGRQPGYNGRNRTFFFFSYDGQRLRLPRFRISDVPSLSARQDPSTTPAIRQLLSAFPLPTGPEKANRFAEHAAAYSNPSTVDATSVRIDHTFSSKVSLFGRYNYSPSEASSRGGTGGAALNVLNSTVNKTQTLTVGLTQSLTASMANEFRANWSKVRGATVLSLDNFGGAILPPEAFFIPSFVSPVYAGATINVSGGNSVQLQVGSLADNLQRQLNLVDNFSFSWGTHQLKFGADYRRLSPTHGTRNYNLSLGFTGINGALIGRTSSATISVFAGPLIPVFTNFSAYGQDTWKATRRLTLTYGLRWELNPPPKEKNGNNPFVANGVNNLATMTLAPFGTPLYATTYNNFAPRIGAAYQLSQRPGRETVLRGGFGIFYDLGNDTAGGAFGNVFPFLATKRFTAATPPFFPLPFFPLTPDQLAPPVVSRSLPTTSTVIVFDPNLKLPRTYQWNVAVEQSLGSNQTVSASYVGAMGRRLLRQQNFALAALSNPNFSNVALTRNTGSSDYHALQVQMQRRLSRGLQLLGSYTWAHSIDDASRDSAFNESFPLDPRIDRGNSDFDIRHAFKLAATYNIPTPRAGAFGKAVLGGWSVDAIFVAQSAGPVNILYFSTTPQFSSLLARPNLTQGVPLYLTDPSVAGGRRINPAAFSIPANLGQGSLGRNSLRGFPLSQLDFVVRREFHLSEKVKLQLGAEFFNLFNHPNFGTVDFIVGDNTFGQAISTVANSLGTGGAGGGLNPLYQVGGPRSIQFSLRLQY